MFHYAESVLISAIRHNGITQRFYTLRPQKSAHWGRLLHIVLLMCSLIGLSVTGHY